MAFLLATVAACFYCSYVMCIVLYRMGPPATLLEFVMIAVYRGRVLTAMLIVTLVLGVALGAFFVFHLWLVLRGETHNEHVKRNRFAMAARLTNTPVDLTNPYNRGAWRNLLHLLFP